MTRFDTRALAAGMQAAQDDAVSLPPFTASHPDLTLADAYEVAGLVHAQRVRAGWRPAGRKIGFTNPEMWTLYGVRHPIWGYMYDRTVVQGDGAPVRCDLHGLVEPRIEPEVVFRLGRAPGSAREPADLLACIHQVAVGVEVVQSHFPGWHFRAADTVMDGGLHGRLIVGPLQAVERLGPELVRQLEQFTVALSQDGARVETGRGSNVLGSPLRALAHLLDVLAQQPDAPPLQAGELVTTGTLTKAYPVQPGQTWSAALDGIALSDLTITFA